ncbi:MAG: hypothetical protein AMK73_06360 [Planctomycetes bacterium SM23_32]|nr:MAG: hypothetical protein AMK73_06360 [Planctomycetes bacterium SM23_32]
MFLGLDLGTTNVKAVVADADGNVLARGAAPVGVRHVGTAGVEQDIEEIWSAAVGAVGRAAGAVGGARVRAVGVSSQGGALQLRGADGRPVGPVISWMDGRGAPCDRELTERFGSRWFAEHVGHGQSGIAVGQLLRLRQEAPEMLGRAVRIGFVGDAIVERLCGRAAHDATSLSIGLLYNPWLGRAEPDLLDELGVEDGQLPDLLPADAQAGALVHEAADQLGLPRGIPVSPAVHDQYASALGCGAVQAGDVMFGAGTAWVLLAASDRLIAPVVPRAFVCAHLVEGLYGQMLSLVNGGSSVAWAARLMGVEPAGTDELDSLVEDAAPGAGGVRFRPLLAPQGGAGLPPGTRGALSGLRLRHGRAHVLRAVVEGLACELARHLRFLTDAGVPLGRLVMCGGAAASRTTPQIVADVAGAPVACCSESDTSAFGAAVLARGLGEPGRPLADIARDTAPDARPVEPGANAALYAELAGQYAASLAADSGAGP